MIDGVEADDDPARISEIKWQEEKTKLLQEQREQRARKAKQGESDG